MIKEALNIVPVNRAEARLDFKDLRKDVRIIEKEYLHLLPDDLKEEYKDLIIQQAKFKDDKVFNAAARMVRLFSTEYLKFLAKIKVAKGTSNLIECSSIESIFEGYPLIISSKIPGYVYVFPYLIIDEFKKQDLENLSYLLCFNVLDTFVKTAKAKPRNWHPFVRAWTKIKKYEHMSVERALTKYSKLGKLGQRNIQAISSAYEENEKPLVLEYADDKPEDYLKMFKRGVQTCMTLDSAHSDCWDSILYHKHHPASIFAYNPYIKGVYATNSNKVIARTYLFMSSKGQWKYGRVYASNGKTKERMITSLQSAGYSQQVTSFSRKVTVKIHGLWSAVENDYLLPIPYTDNMNMGLIVKFNETDKIFTVSFGASNSKANIFMNLTCGFIKGKSCISLICSKCKNEVSKDRISSGRTLSESHVFYCGANCWIEDGFVLANVMDGSKQLKSKDLCYEDFKIPGKFYSNIPAIIEYGGKQYIHDVIIKHGRLCSLVTKPNQYTTSRGMFIKWDAKTFAISTDNYHKLAPYIIGSYTIETKGRELVGS